MQSRPAGADQLNPETGVAALRRMATYDGTLPGRCRCGRRVWLFSQRFWGHRFEHRWLHDDGTDCRG